MNGRAITQGAVAVVALTVAFVVFGSLSTDLFGGLGDAKSALTTEGFTAAASLIGIVAILIVVALAMMIMQSSFQGSGGGGRPACPTANAILPIE